MKKATLSTVFLTLAVLAISAQAVGDVSIKAQLDSQKGMLIDNNFYPVTAVFYKERAKNEDSVKTTFKAQLDSQKELITDYKSYPANDVSYN